ncbi:uncharacterized protein LAESUDRAFT_679565 [Laetiporus sulphureus 93-53]|uniref:Transmembrane protein 135 N-terminal domain-containing protein n=1 Tax=Laetiporus sulphureus 93-53 TaxID=1314785 RepID=A0A165E9N9_9APHY|nr:uncharacterized protein LAESUDRAFT_679565 [Laetiporus sulphureus 93-53]KZT06541.1 hypothetical protein LAESUDRAFT_679565 [Laetiporus sulphureus 93-53]
MSPSESPPSSSSDNADSDAAHQPISRVPSFMQIPFAPKRAVASFENLVVLANYEERLREARRIVWRDRGEKPADLSDLWECLEHAGRGGMRAGWLGFSIRAGVNLILLMTRIKKIPRKYRFALVRRAAFGEDSVRFAAMLGSFVAIYKLVLNALPILLPFPPPNLPTHRSTSHTRSRSLFRASLRASSHPSDSPFQPDDGDLAVDVDGVKAGKRRGSRHARLSASAQAHQVWVRKQTRRWYSILAGSLAGGFAVLFEKRGRRAAIGQQMFVRGLQGSFNSFSSKHGVSIPNGDVLVFSLCCAQIMYAWFVRPETLPRSYDTWIATASKVYRETLSIQRDMVRDGTFKIKEMQALVAKKDTTPFNRTDMLVRIARASLPPPQQSFGSPFVPCSALHPWFDSCTITQLDRFVSVFRWMLPIYGALHLIPMLLFRRARVWREPMHMLLRAGWGTVRSSAFLGVFVFIYQSLFCLKHNLYEDLTALRTDAARASTHPFLAALARALPQPLVDSLVARRAYYVLGLAAGLSLFVEDKHRREELAMYVLPKSLESAWLMARGRGWVMHTGQWGEVLLTAVGMGMVMVRWVSGTSGR